MSTATAVRTGTLPKVNLLPTEISEGAKFRQAQWVMGLALACAVAVIGLLTYMGAGDVNDAQGQLTAAQTEGSQLTAQVASFSDVPKKYEEVAVAQAQLTQAMGQEVHYSTILRDLSLTIPSNVWIKELQLQQPVDSPGSVKGQWGDPAIAGITVQAGAPDLNSIAAWLDSLTKLGPFSDAYVTTATRDRFGTPDPFTFDGSVGVTAKALTHKYDAKAGG